MSSKIHLRPVLAAALLAALLGCGRRAQAAGPEAPPESLIVLPGAENLVQETRGGIHATRYELDAPFPAGQPILEILARLRELGFSPLKEDSLNPGVPTSMVRGWTSYVDASRPDHIRRYIWASEWRNARGELAQYTLVYETPENSQAPLRRLRVMTSVYPADVLVAIQKEAERMNARNGRTNGGGALPPSDGPARTILEARVGGAFLASGPGGEAVFRITSSNGRQAGYLWRFRSAEGKETQGSVPIASSMAAGPFRLGLSPRYPSASSPDIFGVTYTPELMDVIPVPGEQFETLDLAQVHALDTLLPDRNEGFARVPASPARTAQDRLIAFMDGGATAPLGPDRALLVEGAQGRGTVEVVRPQLQSVRYRWRFRAASATSDSSGESEASESPLPELKVGPYLLQWQMRSLSELKDDQGKRVTDWSADVAYLPEECSVRPIPAGEASTFDLSAPAAEKR